MLIGGLRFAPHVHTYVRWLYHMTVSCCQATEGACFSCHLHSRMIDCEQSRRFSFAAVPFRITHIRSA